MALYSSMVDIQPSITYEGLRQSHMRSKLMARIAFDAVTMAKALALATKDLGIRSWSNDALQPLQGLLLEAMRTHSDSLLDRADLPAMASTSADTLNQLLELLTTSEDIAWLLTGVELPQSKDALIALVQKAHTAYRMKVQYDGAHVPQFKFNQISPIPELIGMVGTAETAQWTITQAKQQLYVDMNPLGVEAGAASAMVVYRSFSIAVPFKVDKPAVCFFTRTGIDMPMIACCMEWNDFQSA